MDTYDAIVSRVGRWWHIVVPNAGPLAMTQARRLSEVEYMARDLVATLLEIPADSFDVTVQLKDPVILKAATPATKARAEADAAEQRATDAMRRAARELVAAGLPVRDVATVLKISPSWVSVLTKTQPAAGETAAA
jgi:hypothetical protein